MSKNIGDDINNFEKNVEFNDEVLGSEVKINPEYYIHLALVRLSSTFEEKELKESLIRYRHIVEHIEVLCDSAGLLPENYDDDIKEFKTEDEYKDVKDPIVKGSVLAREKLKIMMSEVFDNKSISGSLKLT